MTAEIEFGDDPTALYRLYGESGVLLYVGIAFDPRKRMWTHAREQSWWGDVVRRTLVWYGTRDEASDAENAAMDNEHPRHNQRLSHPSAPGNGHGVWIDLPSDAVGLYVKRPLARPWFGEVAFHDSYLETIWEVPEPSA